MQTPAKEWNVIAITGDPKTIFGHLTQVFHWQHNHKYLSSRVRTNGEKGKRLYTENDIPLYS